jgi:hypothetical protein
MNWYKKAQLSNVEIIDEGKDYLSIGHEGEYETEEDNVNYLWVFYDGEIVYAEEDWDNPVHDQAVAFEGMPLEILYTGRFESSTGKLSILKPYKGVGRFREIPKIVLSELYRTFPTVEQIYKF